MADPPETSLPRRPLRWMFLALGLLLTALATVGAFLPVLPTTPFLILAAACFVRSSPTFHRRLLANRIFGPYLRQWEHDHTIPRDAKRKAYGLVVLTFGISIAMVDAPWLRITLAVLGVALCGLLAWLPTTTTPLERGGRRAPAGGQGTGQAAEASERGAPGARGGPRPPVGHGG